MRCLGTKAGVAVVLHALCLVLASCSRSEPDAGDEGGDGGHAGEQVVKLDAAEALKIGIRTAPAMQGVVRTTVDLTGEVVIDPGRLARVTPPARGIAIDVPVRVGDAVEAGTVLATLRSPDLAEAKAAYLAKTAALDLATLDLERARALDGNTRKAIELLQTSPGLEALAGLDGIDLGASRGDLLSAYAEYVVAQKNFLRQKQLQQQDVASAAQFQTAESECQKACAAFLGARDDLAFQTRRTLEERERASKVALSERDAARHRLKGLGLSDASVAHIPEEKEDDLARLDLRSPLRGRVIERAIVAGELVPDDAAAFAIADLSRVWVTLTVFQKDLARVRAGQPVHVVFAHGVEHASGTIEYVSPIVEEATRTSTARVVLENPTEERRPGLFVTGEVEIERTEAPVRVPRAALQQVEGRTVVFVQTADGFVPRPVTVGKLDSEFAAIEAGLAAGEPCVVEGAFTLKSELEKAGFAEED